MITLTEAADKIQKFEAGSLTKQLMRLESSLQGINRAGSENLCSATGVDPTLLESALVLKQTAGQINVVVHAVGILLSLPYILQDGELIQYLSLGTGNTGKPFDLETNIRVAEFKFTQWKGGPEAIRQNQLFKDFYLLAESNTAKDRYLYMVDAKYPLKFFNNRRAIRSVLSRNIKLWNEFQNAYQGRFTSVKEYYDYRKSRVKLVDLAQVVPYFMHLKEVYGSTDDEQISDLA